MTIIEALKISDAIRRKNNKLHSGSGGTGFVHIDVLLHDCSFKFCSICNMSFKLSKQDLIADDWEAKPDDS